MQKDERIEIRTWESKDLRPHNRPHLAVRLSWVPVH